jgi:thiol-disulfide isomerase/thioredoxin
MRSTLNSFLVLAMFSASCSAQSQATALNDEIQFQASQPAEQPAAAVETEMRTATADGLEPIALGRPDFHASDPSKFQVASGQLQLVEFFAYWCAVCKAMAPTVHGLEGMYGDSLAFVYLDRDDPATTVYQEQLGYIYQPHFFLLAPDGAVLAQWRGYVDGVELQRALLASIGN